jgi:hypothetical protein
LAQELIMKIHNAVLALLIGVTSAVCTRTASAGLVNGNFATGDLTGWTASAIDQNGNAVTPLISVASSGGTNFAVFDTGNYATGPFVSTLSQSFLVTAAEPILRFELNHLPTLTPDATGTGTSSFGDSVVASVSDGTNTYALLMVDGSGSLTDPFGTAPGTVVIGPSLNSPLNSLFQADLSSLAGQTLTLFLDATNQDDGFQSVYYFTSFQTARTIKSNFTIPEPSSLVLASIALLSSLLYALKRHP